MATRSRTGLWAALILVVLIVGVLVFATTRPDRHDDMGDTWVTTQVQARLFADTDVRGRHIDVLTRDGVVTLRGEVASEAERERAVTVTRRVGNVHRVVDNLTVRPELAEGVRAEDRPDVARPDEVTHDERPLPERVDDGWITTKVQSQYFLDWDIRGRRIEVTTRDGVVTLVGEVETPAEREQAVRIARETEGVRDVQDQLRIVRDADMAREDRPDPPEVAQDVSDRVDDAWITTKIQAQFFVDTDIKGRDIDVTTEEGVVTLSGELESEIERERAVAIAGDTDGVRRVDDRLTVRPAM